MWTVFLSVSYTIKRGNMLRVGVVMDLFPTWIQSIVKIICNVICVALFVVFFQHSFQVISNIKNTNPQSDMPFKQGGSKGKEGPKNGDASMKSDRVMPDLSVKVTQTGPIRTAKGGRPSLLERRSIRTLPSLSRTFPVSSSTLTLIRP